MIWEKISAVHSKIYFQVNDLGNPKNKKSKESPQFAEICEPCKAYLDNEEDIPLPLLARLVKFRLLDIKAKDLKRRETEKKVGLTLVQLNCSNI